MRKAKPYYSHNTVYICIMGAIRLVVKCSQPVYVTLPVSVVFLISVASDILGIAFLDIRPSMAFWLGCTDYYLCTVN
jgi:hypothetical protein